ncbi:MAG: hypothetical protein J0M04_21405 [Verrucomicrobia bacterium]|nr:hypothetical protein [Verrucomicrobiota bacterium]
MSWTDVFPVLSDAQVLEYQEVATDRDRAMLAELCGVARVENPRFGPHLVATSLFWKPAHASEPDFPQPSRSLLMDAKRLGLVSRHAPWEHYVRPLLDGAEKLREERPDIVFRVYLAADLEFLVEDLVAAGCEVMVMKASSLRHNPGALWRFLAFEEPDRWVTITDADHAPEILHNIERSEHAMQAGHGLWRAPYILDGGGPDNDPGFYRPINACQFGAAGGYPVADLMKAMIWHTLRGTMPGHCTIGATEEIRRETPVFGSDWPSYGFDEWFLLAALYPRMACAGVLTFIAWNDRTANHWFALDVEYATWANPRSEVLYFGAVDLAAKLEIMKGTGTARSPLLEAALETKRAEQAERRSPAPVAGVHPVTLVVARYKEDIGWLLDVPDDITVVLYNKGPEILDAKVLARIDKLEVLPNQGREADTYLHHLQTHGHGPADEWTVFCQGDPFPHSPDLLKLLDLRGHWAEVQPLTSGYMAASDIPPANLRVMEDREWVGDIPVYTEFYSPATLDTTTWQDGGGRNIFKDYSQHHRLPRGWSISGHFLELCGLTDLAADAWRASLARFGYGAMFGVRNERLSMIPRECIPQMRALAQGHYSHGYIYEKLWLHIFGLPFIRADWQPLPNRRLADAVG